MFVLTILSTAVIGATICSGIILECRKNVNCAKWGRGAIKWSLSVFIPLLAGAVIILIPRAAYAADGNTSPAGLGFIAAALSTGLATIATGIAVGSVGSSALGAVSEEPKMLGRSLIYVGLAEGIAIYGLIVSILILGRI